MLSSDQNDNIKSILLHVLADFYGIFPCVPNKTWKWFTLSDFIQAYRARLQTGQTHRQGGT